MTKPQKIEGGWANRIRELMSVKSKYATPMLDLVKEKGKCPFCSFVVKYPEFAGANRGVVKHITKTHKEVKGRVDLIIDVISYLLASERQRCVEEVLESRPKVKTNDNDYEYYFYEWTRRIVRIQSTKAKHDLEQMK